MVKQTAGRDALNDFAPKFAELNDDVLFGEVWSREDKLSLKMRSIVTITALISKGIVDNSLAYHLSTARKNGVTKTEKLTDIIDEEVDSLRFYYLGNQYKTKVEHVGVDRGISADGILIM
ncbi:hypothetical protein JCM37172_04330 [Faecalimonas hominis]